MSLFVTALQIYAKRNGGKYKVPARGTPEHAEVLKIMAKLKEDFEKNKKNIAKKTINKKKIISLDDSDDEEILDGEGLKEIADKVKKTTKNLFDAIFNGIRTTSPPKVRELIEKYGDVGIAEMNVCRSPVQKAITTFMNIITKGELKKNQQKFHYDQLYHLYLLLKLKNGVMLRLEKNQVVSITKVSKVLDGDCINVGLNKELTFGVLLATAAEKDKDFWVYDAFKNNCQIFVDKILTANGLNSDSAKKFVVQSAEELINRDPKVKKAAKFVTDLANRIDILIEGRGFSKKKRKPLK